MINQEEYEILKDLDDRLGWLARDRDGDLVAYEKKPEKSIRFWFDNGRMINLGVIFDVGRLLRFIQWEDEEPYNIVELIKEYDKNQAYENFNRQFESLYEKIKETEVKKDLKEAILGIEVTQFDGQKADLEELVNPKQLEKVISDWMPEVLSEELPVIPKYVADWIVDLKSKKIHLLESIYDFTHGEDIHDYMRKHGDVLMRAWLDGFTVGEEQKYYVINNDQRMMLVRMMDGKTITEADPFKLEDMYEVEKKSHRLTEQEIKDYDERYWPFAVLVEELE